jgi:5-methylthioadenosine/S-adenosylhomocysteine deaminase
LAHDGKAPAIRRRIIVAVGAFGDLRRANPDAPIVGDGDQALLPGFVNAHHHVGLSPVQLGVADETLEK